MVDFVFVVDNSIKFHDENLKINSSHYSSLKHLGPYYLTRIQNDISSGCYYNTLVQLDLDDKSRVLMKYGVMSEEALIRDLYDWDYLYVSGRLQKPVKIIKKPTTSTATSTATASGVGVDLNYSFDSINKSIDVALQTNLKNALHASLLLMPEKFTLNELFLTVASLSYTGDFRMVVGENKNKIANIVTPQLAKFVELYKPYIIKV
jgi:translocator assembly and maintenance protein 41